MSPPVILVVDDHDDSRTILSLLFRHHGYRVVAGRDGDEGLQLARDHRPAVLVTDLHLPGQNGVALVRALKNDPETASIASLLLTADAQPWAQESARAAGVDGFLLKPAESHDILAAVRELLNPTATA